ncbi:MAG TPA: ABC transporter permease [Thermoplasmata archaeon]|nr:ABC transporter permease [Thermoplasmata archaeon]
MWTYVARRALLIPPVLIGVVTITFILFTALPIQYQLLSHFGSPTQKEHCGYQKQCNCATLDPTSVHNGQCTCISPPVVTTPSGICQNPVYQEYVHRLGLEKSIPEQWATYVYRTFTFQWGNVSNTSQVSQVYPQLKALPVTTAMEWELPYTLELAALSLLIILVIAIPIGNASAVYRNRPIDQASRVLSFSGYALPAFLLSSLTVMGVVLLFLPHTGFLVHTPWCPAGEPIDQEFTYSLPISTACYPGLAVGAAYPGWVANGIHSSPTGFVTIDAALHGSPWLALDTIVRILLPALVIAYGSVAGLLRFVRNSMLEVMNLDFVRTARAGGVPEGTVVGRHAGRNSLNVTITVLGLTFASFLGGFPIIEDVFKLNGIGELLAVAADPNPAVDFAVIFGSTILFTYIVVSANLIVDVLYAYLDPRVRLG